MEYQKKSVAVEGFEMYQVDTNGIVYAKNGKPLKYSINHNGYCIVNFYVNHKRKGFAIHTLVALTFIPNPEHKPTVNHKDGNKLNNSVTNLEWATGKEQMEHAKNVLHYEYGKTQRKPVQAFDKNTKELKYEFNSLMDAAKFFAKDNKHAKNIRNVIWRCVHNVNNRKTYKGLIWAYTN